MKPGIVEEYKKAYAKSKVSAWARKCLCLQFLPVITSSWNSLSDHMNRLLWPQFQWLWWFKIRDLLMRKVIQRFSIQRQIACSRLTQPRSDRRLWCSRRTSAVITEENTSYWLFLNLWWEVSGNEILSSILSLFVSSSSLSDRKEILHRSSFAKTKKQSNKSIEDSHEHKIFKSYSKK